MTGFRHLGDDLIHNGYVIDLYTSRFAAPDGTEFRRDVVRHPGAVSVVPMLDDATVVLVEQYRAPLDRTMWEIPAGKRDVAEEPIEDTARRELIEEVGLAPGRLELLACFHNSVGFCDEESYVFLGEDLTEVPMDRQGIEENEMRTVLVRLDDVPELMAAGRITDAKTVIGLTTTLLRRR